MLDSEYCEELMRKRMCRLVGLMLLTASGAALTLIHGGAEETGAPPADYRLHDHHVGQLGLECNDCHVSKQPPSVVLARPGHAQCISCHQEDFQGQPGVGLCRQCHASLQPTGSDDLRPYPDFNKPQALLFRFSHAQHLDKEERLDPATGFRADCTFCHKFEGEGVFAGFPGHAECAACHSKPNILPDLTAGSTSADCRQCHGAAERQNPGFSKERRPAGTQQASGMAVNLKFAHLPHLRSSEAEAISCTTCHYDIPQSQRLADLSHPDVLDCVACHDGRQELVSHFRMEDCRACHLEPREGVLPASHSRTVKPLSHSAGFRRHHQEEASAGNAKCFVCHTHVSPAVRRGGDCAACHQVMRPLSHTPRWRDAIHGKQAALDRQACAVCHTADTCSRCHNQVPRSHLPLGLFKAGAHADLATLQLRSCFTCHTFEDTCAACHLQ